MGSFENYSLSARKIVERDDYEQSLERLQKVLGNNVRRLRLKAGLSQERFALMVGLSRQMICSLEFGKTNVKMDNLQRIADGFGVEPWKLLEDTAYDEVAELDDA